MLKALSAYHLAKAESAAIALKNLMGIRERVKGSKKFTRMVSGWNFRELASLIKYKAILAGVPVTYVDHKETSKTCPERRECFPLQPENPCLVQVWLPVRCRQGWGLNIAAKALDAFGVSPWEKGERGTPKSQGDDPGHPGNAG